MIPSGVYKWPALLVVMRHAESEANYHRQYLEKINSPATHLEIPTRDVDVPLTAEGRRQAREAGRYLAAATVPPFDAVYVSPYRRTRETADLVLEGFATHPTPVIEERIREKEFGILEA